jgi:hypothetical protein
VRPAEPGRVLRRALLAWGLGHLAIGQVGRGRALLAAEIVAIAIVAWLAAGLADSSAYLAPFLAGVAFIVAWAWQAIDAYRAAHRLAGARPPAPVRSPAAAIGWLSLPLLVWGTGFWVVAADAASPSAVLDRFVTAWSDGRLDAGWDAAVVRAAQRAEDRLGSSDDRFRDLRVRLVRADGQSATAVVESIRYERRETRFLAIFPGSELVPVPRSTVLTLRLSAEPVELPGGGLVGAVAWHLIEAEPG